MSVIRAAALFAALGILLAGCAGSISAPVPVQPLPPGQRDTLRLSDIVVEAADGVTVNPYDINVVAEKIKSYIGYQSPRVFAGGPGALKLRVRFTRFDRGNALARGMLIGLGQIVLEANVTLEQPDGKVVAEYKVAKDFALGGIFGAYTDVSDVDEGFAKSVAEVVK